MQTQNVNPALGRPLRAWSGLKCLLLGAVLVTGSLGPTMRAAQAAPDDIITTIAGGGSNDPGDKGPATSAVLDAPADVDFDEAGDLFIVDNGSNRVRKVAKNGTITTVAGTGTAGFSGDGGAATSAQLNLPLGVAVDSAGNLFISDSNNYRVRKVDTNGVITTVAGTGARGSGGDGGAATSAQFSLPAGITLDGAGNLFIADNGSNRVRKVAKNGIITTVAGTGTAGFSGDGGAATSAQLSGPYGVTSDNKGNLFITDLNNHRVRKVATNGIITTVAGTGTAGFSGDGGAATSARLNSPTDIAFDSAGNFFIADFFGNRVRKVATNGIITTVAGTGTAGFSGDGGAATSAQLNSPYGVAVDSADNLFVADTYNSRVRKVSAANQALAANKQSVTANEDTASSGALTATKANPKDTIRFAKASDPKHGTVVVNSNGSFTYKPAADYNGNDSFTFTANDGTTNSAPATVAISVTPVNDAPSFQIGADQNVNSGSGGQKIKNFATKIKAGPANEVTQRLTFVLTSDNTKLFRVQPAINSNGALTYTLAPNQSGTANLSVKLQDNGGTARGGVNTSGPQTFAINVVATISAFGVTLQPRTVYTDDTLTATPSNADDKNLHFLYEYFVNGARVQRGSRGGGNTLDLRRGGFGDKGDTVKVVVTATNQNGSSGQATNSVLVSNSAPVAIGGTASAKSGVETLIELNSKGGIGASDLDGDSFIYRRAGQPSNGAATVESRSDGTAVLHYTPTAGFVGTAEVKFYAVDRDGAYSNAATIRVTVSANRASSASAIQSGSAPSGGSS